MYPLCRHLLPVTARNPPPHSMASDRGALTGPQSARRGWSGEGWASGAGVGYVERCAGATQRMRRRHRLPLERRPCCCCACALSAGAAVGELAAFFFAPYGRMRWGAAFRCMKGISSSSSVL